jgi:hypothetical protein
MSGDAWRGDGLISLIIIAFSGGGRGSWDLLADPEIAQLLFAMPTVSIGISRMSEGADGTRQPPPKVAPLTTS